MNEQQEKFLAEIRVEGRPVSANRMWRLGKQRKPYLTDEAAAWEMSIIADTVTQADSLKAQVKRVRNLRIHCEFYGVKGDADNYLKATLDGLKAALGIDDREFATVSSSRRPAGANKWHGCVIQVYGVMIEETKPTTKPIEHVTVERADAYQRLTVMIPADPDALLARDWGFFLTYPNARELRDELTKVLADTETKTEAKTEGVAS